MAQENRRPKSARLSLPGGKPPLRPGKHSWHRNRRSWQTGRQTLRKEKEPAEQRRQKLCECEGKMYDHFPLTVHQMDIIIRVLFALIALFLVLGVTHTSFFGLFGG